MINQLGLFWVLISAKEVIWLLSIEDPLIGWLCENIANFVEKFFLKYFIEIASNLKKWKIYYQW